MRRLLFALLFPLLLIAQQGAFVHGLEHLPSGAATTKTADDRHAPGDPYCEKCFAFAQIGAAADLSAALEFTLTGAFDPIVSHLPLAPTCRLGIPRSRGPPLYL